MKIWKFLADIKLITKELSLCHKLRFLNPNFFKSKCCRPEIFQTMNSGGSRSVSLKYERYSSSGCWDLGIIKLGFVAKIQFKIEIEERHLKLTEYTYPQNKTFGTKFTMQTIQMYITRLSRRYFNCQHFLFGYHGSIRQFFMNIFILTYNVKS